MLLILVGKSGCGKSTVEKYFEKMISFTTRKPRENEIHGKDYYFYDRATVEEAIQNREKGEVTFIKQLSSYAGEIYGTSEEEVNRIKQLDLVVAVMNIEGAKDMKQIMIKNGVDAKIIWVEIDEEIRINRISERSSDTGESLDALKERLNEDYRNHEKYECDIVLENNGSVEEFIEKLKNIAS